MNITNMKLKIGLLLAVVGLSLTASAQRTTDLFGAPRSVVVTPANVVPGASFVTNTVDMIMLDGTVALDIFAVTNTGATGGTLTATLYSSYDKTNFTLLPYALGTNYTVTYTNKYYGGTNLTQADTYALPGYFITPSAASAGWATPYFQSTAFTNTGAINVATANVYHIGFAANDVGRYLHIVWNPGGTVTNFSVGAVVSGATHTGALY